MFERKGSVVAYGCVQVRTAVTEKNSCVKNVMSTRPLTPILLSTNVAPTVAACEAAIAGERDCLL
jgi:hypothetical protein